MDKIEKSFIRRLTVIKICTLISKYLIAFGLLVTSFYVLDQIFLSGRLSTRSADNVGFNVSSLRAEFLNFGRLFSAEMRSRGDLVEDALEDADFLAAEAEQHEQSSSPQTDAEWIQFALRHASLDVDDHEPSTAEIDELLERRYPNIPFSLLRRRRLRRLREGLETPCARFPDYLDLAFDTPHWQVMEAPPFGVVYLYSAHLDVRESNDGVSVRVLTMKTFLDRKWKPMCQLWFERRKAPVVVGVTVVTPTYTVYPQKGVTQGFIINCKLPTYVSKFTPVAVSLINEKCSTATNVLRVIYNPLRGDPKKKFVVCSKGLHYPQKDISPRLVEWVEMLRIMGVHRIYIYDFGSHPNITKTLRHYEEEGFVDRRLISLPGRKQNDPFQTHAFMLDRSRRLKNDGIEVYLHETIARDDCLFRTMYQYEYMNYADPDSVIVPLQHKNWLKMMADVHKPDAKWNSFCFRCALFELQHQTQLAIDHADIPKNMALLNYVHRCRGFADPDYINCFFNPETVVAYGPHCPLKCYDLELKPFSRVPRYCQPHKNIMIDPKIAFQAHYRNYGGMKKCPPNNSDDWIEEKRLWIHKDAFIPRVSKTYHSLGLYKI